MRVQQDTVPILDGARECVEQNIFSSLQPENLRFRRGVRRASDPAGPATCERSNKSEGEGKSESSAARPIDATFSLLFDPQTAGEARHYALLNM